MACPLWIRRVPFGTIAWVAVLGFAAVRFWPQLAAAAGVAGSDAKAPAVRLETLRGDSIRPEALRGKVVLVNFWATWCPPCRVEMPGFQRVWRDRRARGFEVVGVSADAGSPERVEAFLRARGITYPVGMATAELEGAFGRPNVLPTSFLIDRAGRIRYTVRGIFLQPALAEAVDRLLAEPVPAAGGPRPGRPSASPIARGSAGGPAAQASLAGAGAMAPR